MRRLALVLVAMLPVHDADACQCKRSLEDSAKAATSVFVAQLQSMKCTAKPLICTYEVKVESVWRGKPGATPTITVPMGDDCTSPIMSMPGDRILFVLQKGKLALSACDGTQKATDAAIARVTKTLGAPTKP
jgi:hypothetical protein